IRVTPAGEALDVGQGDVIGERELVALLADVPESDHLYTASTLAGLLGVPERRLLAWVKAGLIAPRLHEQGVARFDFGQASVVRTLVDLTDSGVSVAKLRKSLEALRKRAPGLEEPLRQLSTLERNGPLLLRLESGEL